MLYVLYFTVNAVNISPRHIFVVVKPNKKETKFAGIDERTGNQLVELHAAPQDGKANKELERFLSKHYKAKAKVVSGLKSSLKKILLS